MAFDQHDSENTGELARAPQVYAAQGFTRLARWATADRAHARQFGSNPQIMVGLFLIVLGYWLGGDHARLVFFGQHTTGKLVGYREARLATQASGAVWDSESMPIIELTTGQNPVRFQDWMASNFRVPMGGSVSVRRPR